MKIKNGCRGLRVILALTWLFGTAAQIFSQQLTPQQKLKELGAYFDEYHSALAQVVKEHQDDKLSISGGKIGAGGISLFALIYAIHGIASQDDLTVFSEGLERVFAKSFPEKPANENLHYNFSNSHHFESTVHNSNQIRTYTINFGSKEASPVWKISATYGLDGGQWLRRGQIHLQITSKTYVGVIEAQDVKSLLKLGMTESKSSLSRLGRTVFYSIGWHYKDPMRAISAVKENDYILKTLGYESYLEASPQWFNSRLAIKFKNVGSCFVVLGGLALLLYLEEPSDEVTATLAALQRTCIGPRGEYTTGCSNRYFAATPLSNSTINELYQYMIEVKNVKMLD